MTAFSLNRANCVHRFPACIAVGGDNDQPDLLTEACRAAKVLVHEATYTKDIAAFAQSAGLPHLLLTHFSARYQADATRSPSIEDIRSEAKEIYPGQLFLAEDFARYRLDKAGSLTLLS